MDEVQKKKRGRALLGNFRNVRSIQFAYGSYSGWRVSRNGTLITQTVEIDAAKDFNKS